MVLAATITEHHSDNDKEVANKADPMDSKLDRGTATIVFSTSILGSSSEWINVRKKKKKKGTSRKSMIIPGSFTRKVVNVLALSIIG